MTTTDSPIGVVIVDDQELVRAGFSMILESEPDIEVLAVAVDGADGVRKVAEQSPDIVLMDVQMPGTDGIEATNIISRDHPGCRTLILTTFDDDDYLFAALQAGASGFLLKNCPPDDLVQAIRLAADGHALLAPEVTQRVIERSTRPDRTAHEVEIGRLTERERDVLVAMSMGQTNAEIAADLYLSAATVKTHVSSILAKLDVRDRVQAVIAAHESGLMDRPSG